jgi:hypothetical protein
VKSLIGAVAGFGVIYMKKPIEVTRKKPNVKDGR